MTEESLENRVGLAAAQFGVHGLARPGRCCALCGGCGSVMTRTTVAVGAEPVRRLMRLRWTECGPCGGTGRWPA